jgi:GAF domain-containing protein
MENPLASLQALSQALSQTDQPEAVYTVVQQSLARQWGDRVGVVIAHFDAESNKIHLPYVWTDGQRQQLPDYDLQEDTLCQALQTAKPILLSQTMEGPLSSSAGHLGTSTFSKERLANIRFTARTAYSLMVAPFLAQGQAIGAIAAVDYFEAGHFKEDDLAYLVVVAGYLAGREQAAHILARSQQSAAHDRLLYEATTRIRNSVNLQTILDTTAQELGRILTAERVQIELHLPNFLLAEATPYDNHAEATPND